MAELAVKESLVLKQIGDYLNSRRVFWFRLNTGMFVSREHYKWAFRAHSLGPGAADILVLPEGQPPIWVECKNERGRQSVKQKGFELMVKGHGHRYVVARSVDDLAGVV